MIKPIAGALKFDFNRWCNSLIIIGLPFAVAVYGLYLCDYLSISINSKNQNELNGFGAIAGITLVIVICLIYAYLEYELKNENIFTGGAHE